MEHNPALVMLQHFVETLQKSGADRNTVELGQHVVAVFEWMEERLDVLDDREGA